MSISTRVSQWRGWRAFAACFASGALMALAFAPYHLWPVIFISLPVFYLLHNASLTLRQAALRGFFFGYGYFMAGTWWIANALLVDAEKFGWLLPFSILGLSAVMALWFGVFGALAYQFRATHPAINLMRFTIIWVLVEYLRSLGMFGFPWNLAGYIALASTPVAQVASLIGTFGLSFFIIRIGLSPVLFFTDVPRIFKRATVIIPILLIGAAYGYGSWRIPAEIALTETKIRIVQASIPQEVKWTREGQQESLILHADMTREEKGTKPDIIIWPETAFPYTLHMASNWPEQLGSLLQPGQVLLTGAVRSELDHVWNSIVAVDAKGVVRDSYDKHQLVPFGEFVPLRHILPLDKITPGDTDFSRGIGARSLAIDTIPAFSPLVCYEVIFPWMAVDSKDRPQWIVNVTNDGWYGDSAGPYQHYDMARMRAIEQGLPLVRAANNGISAVIDPYGRAVAGLALNARGVIDAKLPRAITTGGYSEYGEKITLILIVIVVFASYFLSRRLKNK